MRALAIIILLCLAPTGMPAQNLQASWPVDSGSRIRIATVGASRWKVGSVVRVDDDTLVFRGAAKDAAVNPIGMKDISQIHVARGTHTTKLRGFMTGTMLGILGGALVGAATYKPPKDCGLGCLDFGAGGAAGIMGFLGGVVGGITGAALGSSPSDTWVPVDIPRKD